MMLVEKLNSLFDKKQQKAIAHLALLKSHFWFVHCQPHQQLLDEGHTVRVEEGEKSSAGEQIKGKLDIKLEEVAANEQQRASFQVLAAHMPLKHTEERLDGSLKESLPG